MMDDGLRALLLADTVVGGLIAKRMYPINLPEPCLYPAITFQEISTVDQYTDDGPTGEVQARLQLDVWAKSYRDTRAVAKAIAAVLNGYFGTLADGTVVRSIERDGSSDGYDSASQIYRVQTDWLVIFEG